MPSTIRKGSRGSDVILCQDSLTKQGYPCEADGIFGSGTESKVKQFQGATTASVTVSSVKEPGASCSQTLLLMTTSRLLAHSLQSSPTLRASVTRPGVTRGGCGCSESAPPTGQQIPSTTCWAASTSMTTGCGRGTTGQEPRIQEPTIWSTR